ncbi:MAG: serine hydrolase domain-containing protein [Chloroflexota bacterium]
MNRLIVAASAIVLASCAGAGPTPTPGPTQSPSTTPAATSTTAPTERPIPSARPSPPPFPIEAFSLINEEPVSEELAAKLQAGLASHDITGGGGMSATVMAPDGTWSGTTGYADGVRELQVDDQFAIASITKSVVAAQIMLMVEAGELALDDLASAYLPEDLNFDTNGATIRQLLGHRSGLPDYYESGPLADIQSEPQRVWTDTELLELVPPERIAPGTAFAYSETNYLLLKMLTEHQRGRPLAEVLRDGVLAVDGLERLVLQPDERPTEPMALPAGESPADGGGYLPSLANASAYTASGGIASDSPTLARWWRAFCAGEVVSQQSLTEMAVFRPADYLRAYGLGLHNPGSWFNRPSFGNTGQLPGFMSWAGCLPEEGAVIVVLTNHEVADGHLAWSNGLARPLANALHSE